MKKQITYFVMAMMMLTAVSAYTQVGVTFDQQSGDSHFKTEFKDKGYVFGEGLATTAKVTTEFSNDGKVNFEQAVTQYGNGQEWPNQGTNEWSMYESQTLKGFGQTMYSLDYKVVTLDPPWSSTYAFAGKLVTPEGNSEYMGEGEVDETRTKLEFDFQTDSPFKFEGFTFTNPIVI